MVCGGLATLEWRRRNVPKALASKFDRYLMGSGEWLGLANFGKRSRLTTLTLLFGSYSGEISRRTLRLPEPSTATFGRIVASAKRRFDPGGMVRRDLPPGQRRDFFIFSLLLAVFGEEEFLLRVRSLTYP